MEMKKIQYFYALQDFLGRTPVVMVCFEQFAHFLLQDHVFSRKLLFWARFCHVQPRHEAAVKRNGPFLAFFQKVLLVLWRTKKLICFLVRNRRLADAMRDCLCTSKRHFVWIHYVVNFSIFFGKWTFDSKTEWIWWHCGAKCASGWFGQHSGSSCRIASLFCCPRPHW